VYAPVPPVGFADADPLHKPEHVGSENAGDKFNAGGAPMEKGIMVSQPLESLMVTD
jgi:hypothetical protein